MSQHTRPLANHYILMVFLLPAEILALFGIFAFGLFNVFFLTLAYPFSNMQKVCAHALRLMTSWRNALQGKN